jgi:hypothetical protein
MGDSAGQPGRAGTGGGGGGEQGPLQDHS